MVNRNKDLHQDDVEITTDAEHTEFTEPDLESVEADQKDIIGSLKAKLKESEADRKNILEDAQRTKADFLNARKRLEEDRLRDKERNIIKHIEDLIPLCDSFMMAMSDVSVWEKADAAWRKGVEGIYAQLKQLLQKYNVVLLNPVGETFDPHRHEALSTTVVKEEREHDQVQTVLQPGYEITFPNGTTELIRPARVVIGVFEKK